MTTVQKVLDEIQALAPASLKMDWDNVGLLCGFRDREVHKILVALDPFEDVVREAISWGAEVIVTHHPLIFKPVRSVTQDTAVGRCITLLLQHGISAINAHTNLDCVSGGVNDKLAQVLGLSNVEILDPMGMDPSGNSFGLLRAGTLETPCSAAEFAHTVKNALGCPGLRYVDAGKPVFKVAVGGGACASELMTAVQNDCDTFVTSDVKYNQFWDAYDLGCNLLDAGHFWTENPVCQVLSDRLSAKFPECTVKISEIHSDCVNFCG